VLGYFYDTMPNTVSYNTVVLVSQEARNDCAFAPHIYRPTDGSLSVVKVEWTAWDRLVEINGGATNLKVGWSMHWKVGGGSIQ